MRRLARALGWVASAALVGIGIRGLVLLATVPDGRFEENQRTLAQLHFLSDDLEARANAMQRLFPEGRVFTLALTGLAWTQMGRWDADGTHGQNPLDRARHVLALLEAPESREPFGPASGLPNGVFYEAWTTRLRVAIAQLATESTRPEADSLASSCRRLELAFIRTPGFLDSYPGAAWPADNVVGAAALAGCGPLLDSTYAETAREWLVRAREHEDPERGLLPHAAYRSQARGSSAALMTPFLMEIDSAYAHVHYRRLVETFGMHMAGVLPAMREYPRSFDGTGDIDSGPIVLGAGAPGSVVAIAAARAVGDRETAQALRTSAERLGLAFTWDDQRRYLFGALPVGDAFLAWASSAPMARAEISTGTFAGWRVRWGLASSLLLALGLAGSVQLWRGRRRRDVYRSPDRAAR